MDGERTRWLRRPPQTALSKKLSIAAWILSAVILLMIGVMQKIRLPLPNGWSTSFLPPVYACLNAFSALVLIVSFVCIKWGKVKLHRAGMILAMILSVLFLLCYVAYHMTHDATKFGGIGPQRIVYFSLLITHVIFAAVSLPFILFTFIAGWTNHLTAHRKLARWVFPLWLYVAITGPVCYWLLRPYY